MTGTKVGAIAPGLAVICLYEAVLLVWPLAWLIAFLSGTIIGSAAFGYALWKWPV